MADAANPFSPSLKSTATEGPNVTAAALTRPAYPRQTVFGLFLCIVAVAVLLAVLFP